MRRFDLPASVVTAMLAIVMTGAAAQEATELPFGVTALGPATVADSDRYRFVSKHAERAYLVDVIRIEAPFGPPAARLPVVFAPDGNVLTTLIPATAKLGSLESLPSMLIVSVSYDLGAASPTEARLKGFAWRFTDFTPSADRDMQAATLSATQQLFGAAWPDDAPFGRADAFLAFLTDELKPFIAAQYPAADVEDSALIGHSLAGLFALHVLFTSPRSFDRYIALDPTQWGDVLAQEEQALGDVAARLFLGASAALPHGVPAGTPTPADYAARLDTQIKRSARQGLRYVYKVYPDETHNSLPPVGIMAGLRAVFDRPIPPGAGPPAVPDEISAP